MLLYLISTKELVTTLDDFSRYKTSSLKLECNLNLQEINHYLWSLQKDNNPLLVSNSDSQRVRSYGFTVIGVRNKNFYTLVDLDHKDLIQLKRDIIINTITN